MLKVTCSIVYTLTLTLTLTMLTHLAEERTVQLKDVPTSCNRAD